MGQILGFLFSRAAIPLITMGGIFWAVYSYNARGETIERLKMEQIAQNERLSLALSANESNLRALDNLRAFIEESEKLRSKLRAEYDAEIQKEINSNNSLHGISRRKENVGSENPEILARAIRASVNRRMRDATRETCISDCGN